MKTTLINIGAAGAMAALTLFLHGWMEFGAQKPECSTPLKHRLQPGEHRTTLVRADGETRYRCVA